MLSPLKTKKLSRRSLFLEKKRPVKKNKWKHALSPPHPRSAKKQKSAEADKAREMIARGKKKKEEEKVRASFSPRSFSLPLSLSPLKQKPLPTISAALLHLLLLGRGLGDLARAVLLLHGLDDADGDRLAHVAHGEAAERRVGGEGLDAHGLGRDHLDVGGVACFFFLCFSGVF